MNFVTRRQTTDDGLNNSALDTRYSAFIPKSRYSGKISTYTYVCMYGYMYMHMYAVNE